MNAMRHLVDTTSRREVLKRGVTGFAALIASKFAAEA
jgi:hypothetical protein